MRYAIAALASLCLGLQPGVGPVAAEVQPAQQSRILFAREDGQFYAVTSDGSEVTGPLAVGAGAHDLAVSPDGRYLAVTSGDTYELRIFRVLPGLEVGEVKGPRPGLSQARYCVWSPDGRYLAAVTEDDGGLRIFRVLPDVEVVEVQALRPGLVQVWGCVWSPDRRHLAVVSKLRTRGEDTRSSGSAAAPTSLATHDDALLGITAPPADEWMLHILPWHDPERRLQTETDETRRLGRTILPPLPLASTGWPEWAPGSDALAYLRPSATDWTMAGALCVLDLATGHSTVLAATDTVEGTVVGGAVAWSPDGRRLAYAAESPSGILVVPPDGSAPAEVLVVGDGQHCYPLSWSRRGDYLAFARSWGPPTRWWEPPRMGLWVLDVESGREVGLTGEKVSINNGTISWSPDASLIAFSGAPSDAARYEWNVYVADPRSGTVSLVAKGGTLATLSDPVIEWLPPAAPRGDED